MIVSGKSTVIDREYRQEFEAVFRDLLRTSTPGQYDENGLPSYTHSNRLMAWLFWKRVDTALRLCSDIDGRTVLDFGCGGCATFKYLAKRCRRIVGCDESLSLARDVVRVLGIQAELYGDLFSVPDTRFDYVLALDVLEHIPDSRSIILHFKKLLARRGRVIVSGPTENLLYRVGRKLAGFSGHYHVRNICDIEKEFVQHGFRREATKTLIPGAPLFRVTAWSIRD